MDITTTVSQISRFLITRAALPLPPAIAGSSKRLAAGPAAATLPSQGRSPGRPEEDKLEPRACQRGVYVFVSNNPFSASLPDQNFGMDRLLENKTSQMPITYRFSSIGARFVP